MHQHQLQDLFISISTCFIFIIFFFIVVIRLFIDTEENFNYITIKLIFNEIIYEKKNQILNEVKSYIVCTCSNKIY